MYKQFPSLAEAFLNYFDSDLVATAEQLEQIGRVRYQVFCVEFGYENAADFPDRKETDEFDAQSLQCLLTHRRSSRPAGCVRLVCASESHQLPIEKYCIDSLYVEYSDTLTEERDRLCEFSRLAVDAAFRRRRGENHTPTGEFDCMDCSHLEQRSFSMTGIATFLAAFALARLSNRTHIFAMMEANLPRLLRQSGIPVQQAGDSMYYHGMRAPYFITTERALANMRQDLRQLYDAIENRLADGFNAREHVA